MLGKAIPFYHTLDKCSKSNACRPFPNSEGKHNEKNAPHLFYHSGGKHSANSVPRPFYHRLGRCNAHSVRHPFSFSWGQQTYPLTPQVPGRDGLSNTGIDYLQLVSPSLQDFLDHPSWRRLEDLVQPALEGGLEHNTGSNGGCCANACSRCWPWCSKRSRRATKASVC
jgi:hypothetical protein